MNKSKTYWENRQTQWLNNQDKMDKAASRELGKQYKRMSREVERDISSYFARYGKDNVIEYRKLMESLSASDRQLLMESVEEFVTKYPQHAHLAPVRESIYRLNRMQGLHYSMNMRLLELGAIEHEIFERHLLETYGKRYEALFRELRLGDSFLSIDDELMRSAVYQKWLNDQSFSERIWANKERMLNYMQTEFRDSIVQGDNYNMVAREISKRFDVGMNDARRLVTTESSFVYNQSQVRPYIDAGIDEYEISAILDRKTSTICRELDGESFKFDDIQIGINFPPFHPWCRTTFIGKM